MQSALYQKLVVVDMDGTLLLPGNTSIGELTISTLKKLISKRVLVVIASGRPYRSMVPFYNLIGVMARLISL